MLHIDPASSFGTGTHHTTQLCLKQLEKVPVEGASVLDMGCGSGILGIAAALLGAKRVTAVDIDEASVGVTRENVLKNGIDPEKFTLLCGDCLLYTSHHHRPGGRHHPGHAGVGCEKAVYDEL